METKLDRRSARTRDSLLRALHELIRLKPYEEITSAEICEYANVGRSTFYVHYKSKDHLKSSVFESLRRAIAQETESVGSNNWQMRALSFSRPVFEHAYTQRAHYRLIAKSRGGQIALRALKRILLQHLKASMPKNEEHAYLAEYIVGAFLSMLTIWLDRGAPESALQMDARFKRWAHASLASD